MHSMVMRVESMSIATRPKVGELARLRYEGEIELGVGAVGSDAVLGLVVVQGGRRCCDAFDARAAGELGDFLEVGGFDFQPWMTR